MEESECAKAPSADRPRLQHLRDGDVLGHLGRPLVFLVALHRVGALLQQHLHHPQIARRVALQDAFVKSKGLKPGFHFILGSRVETRRSQAMGQLNSNLKGKL
jgi:hypothetical protein